MTLKKAEEVMVDVNAEKATYLNTLEYGTRQMKEADLHAALVKTELKETKDEIRATEAVLGALATYEMTI